MTMNWKTGGLALGVVFFLAVLLVKPIGVSTQFVILDGILWNSVDSTVISQTADGVASTNAYLDKSNAKYAKNILNPMNYSFLFVVAMVIGAAISSYLRGGVPKEERSMSPLWRANFGDAVWKRYAAAFVGGFVVLYGARLAGGCTSGHMMSGIMQTSLSGYIFTLGAFGAAIPASLLMYKKG